MDKDKQISSNPINLTDLNKLAFSMLENNIKDNNEKDKKEDIKKEIKTYESTVHELFDLPKKKNEHVDTPEEKIEESINNKIDDIELNFENIEINKDIDIKDINEIKFETPHNSFQAVPMDVDYIDPTITIPTVNEQSIMPIQSQNSEDNNTSDNSIEINNDLIDKELIEDYVGNNFNKINKRIINFSALFFGPFYYLYRKMYVSGIILLIFQTLIIYFIKNVKYFAIMELSFLLINSLLFNTLYMIISKKRVNKIRKVINDNSIKEKCVLKGGTDLLISSLISIGYIIIIILFFSSSLFNFFSKFIDLDKIFNQNKKDEISTNATDFANMLESYSATAKLNIDQPEAYKYMLNDEEYVFIALPVANDEKNIYCIKSNKNSKWENKENFEVKENSTTCDEFMDDVINNYSKFYKINLPDSGQIVLSSEGKIQNDSKLVFGDKKCQYDLKEKEFVCK